MNDLVRALELDEILGKASSYAVSECGRRAVASIVPSSDLEQVERRLKLTSQAALLIDKYRYGGVEPFSDITDVLEKARAGAMLSPADLLAVASVLGSARTAKSALERFPDDVDKVRDIAYRIFADTALENDIRRDIISETEINDTASAELRNIRSGLRRMKSRLIEKLSSFTRSNEYSKYLQDNFYTVRAGRYVLPVRSECRQGVHGLLHDQSSTGSTVYIEPFEIVTMNNDIVRLEGDERREIERILREYSVRVTAQADNLDDALARLTLLDTYFALAGYSASIDGILPEVNYAGKVRLIGARHPLIAPAHVVPIDISVGDGADILLISGPNTGGKTVSLKTVGLLSLMLSCGLLLPCKPGSVMAVFDRIFCDIGDDQNISMNLSTFSSHIKNLKEITESFTNESLILLDEIGSCTAPEEGAAIAIGVMEYIAQTKAKAIITTHYPQLKEYAMTSGKIRNAGMQFDPQTLKPTYRLLMGYPGSSNALETAAALGLSSVIIDRAKTQLSRDGDNYEELLKQAFLIKSKAEEELAAADKAKAEADAKLEKIAADERKVSEALERINANARAETKRLVGRAAEKANDIVEEIKRELRDADERALLKAKKDLKRLEALAYEGGEEMTSVLTEKIDAGEIVPGARVVVKSFGLEGTVKKVRADRKQAEIECGGKLLTVRFEDLARPAGVRRQAKKAPEYKPVPAPVEHFSDREINVIGSTVADAWDEIEPMLDTAARTGLKSLRIVHGKGTGALGKGIQSYLRSHPAVKSYRYGRYGEGDNGVTIVELK